jgi:hypothetical protein
LTGVSRLPFDPEEKGQGYVRPRAFLYRQGAAWRATWLRPDGVTCYRVTLFFRWRRERIAGCWKLHLEPRRVGVVVHEGDAGTPVARLPGEAVDTLIAFLAQHWPGVSADVLRTWLAQLRTTGPERGAWAIPGLEHLPSRGGRGNIALTEEQRMLLIETAETLKGHERRLFMARTVKALGRGGQRRAEAELGWNRVTVRKGMRELESGLYCLGAYAERGRKRAEERLPGLLRDIWAIKAARPGGRMSAGEVRRRLIVQKGYHDEELPCERTIRAKLNQLNRHGRRCGRPENGTVPR